MRSLDSEIVAFRDKQKAYLEDELKANGGSYQKWYDDLLPFRDDIIKHYITMIGGKEIYNYCGKHNLQGDLIDHHIVSYLAPLTFSRIGWNGDRLRPFEQIRRLGEYIVGGGDL